MADVTCRSNAKRGDESCHGDGDGGDNGGSSGRRKEDESGGSGSYGMEEM